MGWEDRDYYRDGGTPRGRWLFLLFGSVPLFTLFRVRVRAHMSLVLFIGLILLIGGIGSGWFSLERRAEAMGILFVIILMHEFGHCFAARWVGGDADEIIMTPLGGLAMAHSPRRPLPTFITVAGGPAVNVLICVLAVLGMYLVNKGVQWNPLHWKETAGYATVYLYLYWIYSISLALLLFNLLPIFPLDGGQMLQSILWPKLGYYRSMNFACVTGIIGGGILVLLGIFSSLLLVCVGISGILTCVGTRRALREVGPESEFAGDGMDYSASLEPDPPKRRRRVSRWTIRRLRRQAQRDAEEQQLIDTILAKVSAHGMASLTWSERRALRRATQRQRQRELEPTRVK
jgi:stage IV sporulation protein FB